MKRIVPAALAALALSACATQPTLYRPAEGPRGPGYSEMRIEPGRYRITFRGGPGAPAEQVSDYALVRAADLTIAEGYDWFRVADRYIDRRAGVGGPRMSVGVGGGDFGRRGGVSVGVGTDFELGGGPALSATVEVVMGRGERPKGADVYDARAVRRTLGEPT
jgi:hypothetical protein